MIEESRKDVLSNDNFPFSTASWIRLNLGDTNIKDILILRITFVGELGYELYTPVEICESVVNILVNNSKGIKVCIQLSLLFGLDIIFGKRRIIFYNKTFLL